MGLIIVPGKSGRLDYGWGMDRDGPPRDMTVEHWCRCRSHDDAARPRRFDGRAGDVPICPACRMANRAAYDRAQAEGVPDGNRALRTTRATSGTTPVTKVVVRPKEAGEA